MSKTPTPQELGYQWDYELARLVGGERHAGSGNRAYQRLDASGHSLIFSGKHTIHGSFTIAEHDLDEMLRATVGPEGIRPNMIPILGTKFGQTGRTIATLDLAQLLDWVRKPPELVPSTKQDGIRRTARTPSLLRGD